MAFLLRGGELLSGVLMPLLLCGTGLWFALRLRFFWILHPFRFFRTVGEAGTGGTSSFQALTVALAGTLGVGNIAGVATAITAGGPGAVFWMWAGALAAMSVKYTEAALAVRHRRTKTEQGKTAFYGGAMYYIRDGLRPRMGARGAAALGGVFALFCLCNSLLTGTLVQVNAAAAVYPGFPPLLCGILFALAALAVNLGGARRISSLTVRMIPLLSAVYLLLSLWIIGRQAGAVPDVLRLICREAFSLRPAAGGLLGCGMAQAIRFGMTRGIFSNEAGCGTSPTAHAAADARSPHAQGCYGILEVFVDTVVLCTVTALVILLAFGGNPPEDGIPLSLLAYERFAGSVARQIIAFSVLLFAYATVICQFFYGTTALEYLTPRRLPRAVYTAAVSLCCIGGAVIPLRAVWAIADAVISVMTVCNVLCLWFIDKRGLLPPKPAPRHLSRKRHRPPAVPVAEGGSPS